MRVEQPAFAIGRVRRQARASMVYIFADLDYRVNEETEFGTEPIRAEANSALSVNLSTGQGIICAGRLELMDTTAAIAMGAETKEAYRLFWLPFSEASDFTKPFAPIQLEPTISGVKWLDRGMRLWAATEGNAVSPGQPPFTGMEVDEFEVLEPVAVVGNDVAENVAVISRVENGVKRFIQVVT